MNSVTRAYNVLRAKSVRFGFKPGERLNEVELAKKLGMSRSPVREAMNRLVTEGLLTVVPNQGFSCRKLSASEITSLYSVRADLEVGGIHEAVQQNDPQSIHTIVVYWDKVVAEAKSLSIDDLVTRDEEFHLRIAALGGNLERARMLEHINARIQFVRRVNLESSQRSREGFAEHHQLLQHLLTGDEESAANLLRNHLLLNVDQAMEAIRLGLAQIYSETMA